MKLNEIKPLVEISNAERKHESVKEEVASLVRAVKGWSLTKLEKEYAKYKDTDPRARAIFNEMKKRGDE